MKAFHCLVVVFFFTLVCAGQTLDNVHLSGYVYGSSGADTTHLYLASILIENLESGSRDSVRTDCTGYWSFTVIPSAAGDHHSVLPASLLLAPSYPNPFSETTTIRILNNAQQRVRLDVFNVLGQHIAELYDNNLRAGAFEFTWNGVNPNGAPLAQGTYFLSLNAGGRSVAQQIVVLGSNASSSVMTLRGPNPGSSEWFGSALAAESKESTHTLDDFWLRVEVRHCGYDTASTSFSIPDGQDTMLTTNLHQRAVPPAGMILVPADTFEMGATYQTAATPVHTVYVPAFYIDIYEVTNAEYKAFCDSTGQPYPSPESVCGSPYYFLNPAYANYPVTNISWHEARVYAEWAGKRLPTEAEWELACKGSLDNRRYPWGETWVSSYANIINNGDDGYEYTAPVGTYPEGISPVGCYEMIGNAWEWVEDDYHANYNGAPTDGSAWIGSPRGNMRSIRGSSWYNLRSSTRCAYRVGNVPSWHCGCIGFRCARDAE